MALNFKLLTDAIAEGKASYAAFQAKTPFIGVDHGGKSISLIGQFGAEWRGENPSDPKIMDAQATSFIATTTADTHVVAFEKLLTEVHGKSIGSNFVKMLIDEAIRRLLAMLKEYTDV